MVRSESMLSDLRRKGQYQDRQHIRIEICGGIASGKTTLARLIGQAGPPMILENFGDNPFWEDFYADPQSYAFETEIAFLLQHYHQLKKESAPNAIVVCDFSFLLDLAYAEMGLNESRLQCFLAILDEIESELSRPRLVVHLLCDAKTELDRIRARGRAVEATITVEFLEQLNQAVADQVKKVTAPLRVVTIDSAINDFAHDEAVQREVLKLVLSPLGLLNQ